MRPLCSNLIDLDHIKLFQSKIHLYLLFQRKVIFVIPANSRRIWLFQRRTHCTTLEVSVEGILSVETLIYSNQNIKSNIDIIVNNEVVKANDVLINSSQELK